MVNKTTADFEKMVRQVDKRLINSHSFIKNVNAYVNAVPELVDADV